VASGDEARTHGGVFDGVAAEYDGHRPGYPDALIDRACEVARLAPGARVLEIGCGTGQLTLSLLARGLRVTAVEPGARLIARADERLAGAGEVQFVHARLEEASLPHSSYQAVFSASAIHWVDPDVSWRTIARALVDGGTLALLSYFGVDDPRSRQDQQAFRATLARIAPELASQWPSYRDLKAMFAGVAQRRENISEVWGWLGGYELARPYAAELFSDVRLTAMPVLGEHSADALNGLLGTMSFWGRLSALQRDALVAGNRALHERLGRLIRSSAAACLATARRSPDRPRCSRS
jgi:ubiquinone/menaquinone biosynthesis C-methylase UbiE